MKELATGLTYSIKEEVAQVHAASALGSGALDVFSTPSMIAMMEKASMLCINDCMNENQTTVGGAVNIRHLKASAIGSLVECISKVVSVDGKKVEFEVSATVNEELIGNGFHTRYIVDKQKFMSNL